MKLTFNKLRKKMMNAFYLVVTFSVATLGAMWQLLKTEIPLKVSMWMVLILALGFALGLFYAYAEIVSEEE